MRIEKIRILARELYYFSHQVKRKTTRSILRNLPFCLCHLECNEIRFTSPASSHYWDESEIYYCPFRRFPSTREWQIYIVILNVIQQASAVQRTALTRWVGALPLLSTPIQSPTHYIRWTPFGWINTSTPPSVPLKRGRNTNHLLVLLVMGTNTKISSWTWFDQLQQYSKLQDIRFLSCSPLLRASPKQSSEIAQTR